MLVVDFLIVVPIAVVCLVVTVMVFLSADCVVGWEVVVIVVVLIGLLVVHLYQDGVVFLVVPRAVVGSVIVAMVAVVIIFFAVVITFLDVVVTFCGIVVTFVDVDVLLFL